MTILNTYNIINLKEKTNVINCDDAWIHHYYHNHYKYSENFTTYCLLLHSNKTMAKFSLYSTIKQLAWPQDIQYVLLFMPPTLKKWGTYYFRLVRVCVCVWGGGGGASR